MKHARPVTRKQIGHMPGAPSLALSAAMQARSLRHVLACNCGRGHEHCTGTVERTPMQNDLARRTDWALAWHVIRARRVLRAYRANRTWPKGRKIPPKQG